MPGRAGASEGGAAGRAAQFTTKEQTMLWDVEFIVAFTDGTWVSQSEVISEDDIDQSEGMVQGFVNQVAERMEDGSFFSPGEVTFIGVLHYSQYEECHHDA